MCVQNGHIYIAGGMVKVGNRDRRVPSNSMLQYHPGSDGYDACPNMPVALANLGVVNVGSKIICFGGKALFTRGEYRLSYAVYVFDLFTTKWSSNCSPMPTARADMSLHVNGTRVYIYGGFDSVHSEQYTVDIYDTADDSWQAGGENSVGYDTEHQARSGCVVTSRSNYFDYMLHPARQPLSQETSCGGVVSNRRLSLESEVGDNPIDLA
jgi:N-acetylneuraminic acid mutarotase